MTSSGTYAYSPAASNLLLTAYARIGIRRTAITAEHVADGITESNLVLVEFTNKQPLLWKSELISQVLTQGTATYTLPSNVVMILLAYIETGSGTSTIDRVLGPLSTVEYASLTNKTQQSQPTCFWLDRQITPTITLWQVPDGGGPYTLYMRCVTQVQDAVLPSGVTMDLPYRFLDAFTAGLAYRLARIHAPALEQQRKMDAMEAWMIASTQDVENVPVMIMPGLGGYYR
jgi:hypothetical protein